MTTALKLSCEMNRDLTQVPLSSVGGKRSIFARQLAAQRQTEGKTTALCGSDAAQTTRMDTDRGAAAVTADVSFLTSLHSAEPAGGSRPRLVSGQGLEGPDGPEETDRIHRENQAKLQEMSQAEILEEQKKLLSQLGEYR